MLAKRLPTVLPPLTLEEALEVTKIHSIAGALEQTTSLIVTRPFRAPHHTISDAGLLGGQSIPRPGEISLAHNGVLFLDELPEFRRNALEVLRQPLESGEVTISRASGSFTFPANFMLVAAMNPCPCGYYTDQRRSCRCNPYQIQKYLGKISGPLLDRIDIHLEVRSLECSHMLSEQEAEPSSLLRERVKQARKIQRERLAKEKIKTNSRMGHRQIKKYCPLNPEAKQLLKMAIDELGFSARAYDKILKVARTVSDLAASETILPEHIAEAIQYRSLDREFWR
jgi:magnesium chelatase family protein